MRTKQTWIHTARLDDQGSFCDTESQINYENKDAFRTQVEIIEAGDRGDEVINVDAPVDPSDGYGADQRFNIRRTETDGQGLYYQRKEGPGR